MSKQRDLENDLKELADTIQECVVGSWWDTDKGCGCPMSQLAVDKGIATAQEIEDEYVHGIGEVQPYLEDRFMAYYPGQGHLIRKFPIKFDHTFDDMALDDLHSSSTEITYSNNRELIKAAMLKAIEKAKESV